MRILFRAHQLFHYFIQYDLLKEYTGLFVLIMGGVIGGIVGIIHLQHHSEVSQLLIIPAFGEALVVIILILKCVDRVNEITEASKEFEKSFRENDINYQNLDKKFFKSCPPNIWKLGVVEISPYMSPLIINDVIIMSVINILLLL